MTRKDETYIGVLQLQLATVRSLVQAPGSECDEDDNHEREEAARYASV